MMTLTMLMIAAVVVVVDFAIPSLMTGGMIRGPLILQTGIPRNVACCRRIC